MAQRFKSRASSTLAGPIGAGDTTLTLVSAVSFPTPGTDWDPGDHIYLVVQEGDTFEIVKATAISGNVLTVERGQEGFAAQAFGMGAVVECRPTGVAFEEAASLKDFAQRTGRQIALGDTNFGETVEDSIDRGGSTWNPATRMLDLVDHEGVSIDGFPIHLPEPPDAYDDAALVGRVEVLEAFEASVRVERQLGTFRWTQGASRAAIRAAGIALPAVVHDQEFVVTFVDSGNTASFALKQLRDKQPVTTPGTQLVAGNSVSATEGGVVFRFAHDNATGLFVGTEDIAVLGNLSFAIRETMIPADLLPKATATEQGIATLPEAARQASTTQAGVVELADGNDPDDDTTRAATPDYVNAQIAAIPAPEAPTASPNAVEADQSGLGASDDGSFPAWSNGSTPPFDMAAIDDSDDLEATYTKADTSWRLRARGKLARVRDIFSGGDWAKGGSAAATEPFIATTFYQSDGNMGSQPTLAQAKSLTYQQSITTGPLRTNIWRIVRVPLAKVGLVHNGDMRLDIDDDEIPEIVIDGARDLDSGNTDLAATYRYFAVFVPTQPASGTLTVEEREPFHIDPSAVQQTVHGTRHFRELFPGLTITNPAVDYIQTSPTLLQDQSGKYLEIDDNSDETLRLNLHLRMERISNSLPNLAFRQGVANATVNEQERIYSIAVPLSDLNEEQDFVANRDPTNWRGIEAIQAPAWNGTTAYGQYEVFVTRQTVAGKRRVGVIVAFDSDGNGTNGVGWTYAAELRASIEDNAGGGSVVQRTFGQIATGLIALTGAARTTFMTGIARGLETLLGNARLSYNHLRDKPTIPTLRTFAAIATGLNGLAGAARLSYNSLKDTPTGGGGGGAPTFTRRSPAADMSTPALTNAWPSSFTTLATLPALTADQAGDIDFTMKLSGKVSHAQGGGDRVWVEIEVTRTRASVETAIGVVLTYVRNASNFGGNTQNNVPQAGSVSETSQQLKAAFPADDVGQAGDVYALKIRARAQQASPTKTFDVDAANTQLVMKTY